MDNSWAQLISITGMICGIISKDFALPQASGFISLLWVIYTMITSSGLYLIDVSQSAILDHSSCIFMSGDACSLNPFI